MLLQNCLMRQAQYFEVMWPILDPTPLVPVCLFSTIKYT
jgi:hypothetical protein